MANDQALEKFVSLKNFEDVKKALTQMESRFLSVCSWIKSNRPRDERSVTLLNLLSSSAQYLRVASDNLEAHISIIALATRSLYELNVRARAILASDEHLQNWVSEVITDKIQTLEGLLELNTVHDMTAERSILFAEIGRLNGLRQKYKLPTIKKPADAGLIAREVGLSYEHKALFKLFSKLVHPSSYLINDYGNAASDEVRITLQIHTQLYAWDTFSRICDGNVPRDVQKV